MNESGTEPHSEVTDEHGAVESQEEVHEEEVHEEEIEVHDEGVHDGEEDQEGEEEIEVHDEGVHDEEEGHEGEVHEEEAQETQANAHQGESHEAHQEGESHEHELDAHSDHSPLSPSPAANDEGEITPMREKFQVSSHREEGNDIEDMVNLLEFGKPRPISIASIPDEADVYDIPDEE